MNRGSIKADATLIVIAIGIMLAWTFIVLPLVCSEYKPSSVSNNCLWHKNSCVEKCPDHLVEKISDCSISFWPAQRTCTNPQRTLVGTVCGFSRCDCPGVKVLDTETGYCYDFDNCPTKHISD